MTVQTIDLGAVNYGDTPYIYFSTSDEFGILTSATVVTVITRSPAGVETSITSPNAALSLYSTGVWKYVVPTVLVVGTWFVRFKATATILDVQEFSFDCSPSNFTSP